MNFFTIGYGGRGDPAAFTEQIGAAGVRTVADVRAAPGRAFLGVYALARTPDHGIQRLLADAGIGYASLTELGNPFRDAADWQERFSALLARDGDRMVAGLFGLPQPFCLLCAERDVEDCHRKQIAEYLVDRGHTVEHLP